MIGPGAGVDVIVARLHGARDVTAVEVNPLVARGVMSSEPFRASPAASTSSRACGWWSTRAAASCADPRESTTSILGTMVDTWAATAAGAFALTENNLYTRGGLSGLPRAARPGRHLEPDALAPDAAGPAAAPPLARAASRWPSAASAIRGATSSSCAGRPEDGQPLATVDLAAEEGALHRRRDRAAPRRSPSGTGSRCSTRRARDPDNDLARLVEASDPEAFWNGFRATSPRPPTTGRSSSSRSRPARLLERAGRAGSGGAPTSARWCCFGVVGISARWWRSSSSARSCSPARRVAATRGRLPFLLYFAAPRHRLHRGRGGAGAEVRAVPGPSRLRAHRRAVRRAAQERGRQLARRTRERRGRPACPAHDAAGRGGPRRARVPSGWRRSSTASCSSRHRCGS